MSTRPFDAVLCDLDGVLRRWAPMDRLDLAYGLPTGTLATAAFSPTRLTPAITGARTDEQWRGDVADDLAGVCGSAEQARRLVAEWSAAIGEVDGGVAELLSQARRHVPVILVTNATSRLEADLDALGITAFVDDVVNSARVGFAKPDHRIFRAAADRAAVQPDRCLFVDDTAENTEAAAQIGMTVVHYRSVQQLRGALGY